MSRGVSKVGTFTGKGVYVIQTAHCPSPDDGTMIQFHVLSFEGPDAYSRAGGLATRISGLTEALADVGFETHLWFVGDPSLPGSETRERLHLHRWCQWISRYHPGGVYDGEEGKRADFASSLPPHLVREVLVPRLRGNAAQAIILADEWQTVDAVLHLDWLLRGAGIRDQVTILWNANNLCGFDRIDWLRLAQAAVITTVSRYMQHLMWNLGVDPIVIPNGLSADTLRPPDRRSTATFRHRLRDRIVLSKVARWDPDKRWLLAIDTVGELKRVGLRPLLIARGGVEAHGAEVLARAAAAGLRVVERSAPSRDLDGLLDSLKDIDTADIVSLRSYLTPEVRRVLFRGAAAVLANSGHEPFGLVGLEAMAAGGLACTGSTGEDYAVPGWNALVLQSNDPREFVSLYGRLLADPAEERAVRHRGRATAQQYAWTHVVRRNFLPRVQFAGGDVGANRVSSGSNGEAESSHVSWPTSLPPRAPLRSRSSRASSPRAA
jgi:glycosyltransferase involved in cell wall biosynthesis